MSAIDNLNKVQINSEIYYDCDVNKLNYSQVMKEILQNMEAPKAVARKPTELRAVKEEWKKSGSTQPNNSTTLNQNNQNFSESCNLHLILK
jgi:hypothetical protein